MASPQKPCHICDKPAAKYTCPKCGISYCTLGCYRDTRHQGCTESFYKHQVEEAVQAQRVDEETKQEMQQIVQQYEDQIDQDQMKAAAISQDSDDMSSINSDDEDETSLAERLQGIDLSGDMDANTLSAVWKCLSQTEQNDFIHLVNSQDVEPLVTPWHPWWIAPSALIVMPQDRNEASPVPAVLDIGASIQSLSGKVHPSVLFQLTQISLAYVYMMRHLNGEPYEEHLASAFEDMIKVAPLLASQISDVYSSAIEALKVGFCNIDDAMSNESKCALLDDMLAIYANPAFVVAMVSDAYSIVDKLLNNAAPATTGIFKKSQVRYAEKRLYFIISMVKQIQQMSDPWKFMAADLALLKHQYTSEARIFKE